MKKLFSILLTLLSVAGVYALPVGNPWDASLLGEGLIYEVYDNCGPCGGWLDLFSFRFGFYGDYVFDRHLKFKSFSVQDFSKAKIFTNAGYLAVNVWKRFDVFATLGATSMDWETRTGALLPVSINSSIPVYIESNERFSWSVGGRATLWECGCLGVGLEGQYFQACPDINYIRTESFPPTYLYNVKAKYKEWQVGLGAAYWVDIGWYGTGLVPYAAIKWSQVNEKIQRTFVTLPGTGTFTTFDPDNQKNWGYAVGLSLVGCKVASVTVEGRFADEKAVHVNSQIRF
jgi:major outer membrane protein